jgi:hypothetical protein
VEQEGGGLVDQERPSFLSCLPPAAEIDKGRAAVLYLRRGDSPKQQQQKNESYENQYVRTVCARLG